MYYIYHIPNVKIGCTHNLQNRLRQQTKGEWEILETHTDIDIASQRELQLQKEYGYEVDKSTYKESVQNFKLESVVKAGRASATKSWQNHRERELEKCSKGGKIGGSFSYINSQKKTCPYCNKEFSLGTYGRWHGDRCKKKLSK